MGTSEEPSEKFFTLKISRKTLLRVTVAFVLLMFGMAIGTFIGSAITPISTTTTVTQTITSKVITSLSGNYTLIPQTPSTGGILNLNDPFILFWVMLILLGAFVIGRMTKL